MIRTILDKILGRIAPPLAPSNVSEGYRQLGQSSDPASMYGDMVKKVMNQTANGYADWLGNPMNFVLNSGMSNPMGSAGISQMVKERIMSNRAANRPLLEGLKQEWLDIAQAEARTGKTVKPGQSFSQWADDTINKGKIDPEGAPPAAAAAAEGDPLKALLTKKNLSEGERHTRDMMLGPDDDAMKMILAGLLGTGAYGASNER